VAAAPRRRREGAGLEGGASRWVRGGAAATAAALSLAGCGLGAGSAPSDVSVLVTTNFGTHTVTASQAPKIVGADTVMRMLERNARVQTSFGGGFVDSIDALSGSGEDDWFYYVNGVLAPKGAAATKLHGGDHVWWDRHDWSAAETIPAVVGSFPEPFTSGIAGKHLPLRIECTAGEKAQCTAVQSAFAKIGLAAFQGCLLCSEFSDTLRVVVGPWSALRADPTAQLLAQAPSASGVYARFLDGGRRLDLLDQAGRVVRTAGPAAGLIAATARGNVPPAWYVTGTDPAGVAEALLAFNPSTLDGHFAVAVIDDAAIPLPETTP
jgi:hypothetical protein